MKDPLFSNKLAAAVLAAALIIVGIPVLSKTFGGHHGAHHSEGWPFPHYPEIDLGVSANAAEAEAPPDLGTLSGERKRGWRRAAHSALQVMPYIRRRWRERRRPEPL